MYWDLIRAAFILLSGRDLAVDVLISCSLYLYMSVVRLSLLSFLRSGLCCLRVNLPKERPNFRQYLGNKPEYPPKHRGIWIVVPTSLRGGPRILRLDTMTCM